MDNVACVGNEFSLGECRFTPGSQSSCGHDKDVGILCGTAQTHGELHRYERDADPGSSPPPTFPTPPNRIKGDS